MTRVMSQKVLGRGVQVHPSPEATRSLTDGMIKPTADANNAAASEPKIALKEREPPEAVPRLVATAAWAAWLAVIVGVVFIPGVIHMVQKGEEYKFGVLTVVLDYQTGRMCLVDLLPEKGANKQGVLLGILANNSETVAYVKPSWPNVFWAISFARKYFKEEKQYDIVQLHPVLNGRWGFNTSFPQFKATQPLLWSPAEAWIAVSSFTFYNYLTLGAVISPNVGYRNLTILEGNCDSLDQKLLVMETSATLVKSLPLSNMGVLSQCPIEESKLYYVTQSTGYKVTCQAKASNRGRNLLQSSIVSANNNEEVQVSKAFILAVLGSMVVSLLVSVVLCALLFAATTKLLQQKRSFFMRQLKTLSNRGRHLRLPDGRFIILGKQMWTQSQEIQVLIQDRFGYTEEICSGVPGNVSRLNSMHRALLGLGYHTTQAPKSAADDLKALCNDARKLRHEQERRDNYLKVIVEDCKKNVEQRLTSDTVGTLMPTDNIWSLLRAADLDEQDLAEACTNMEFVNTASDIRHGQGVNSKKMKQLKVFLEEYLIKPADEMKEKHSTASKAGSYDVWSQLKPKDALKRGINSLVTGLSNLLDDTNTKEKLQNISVENFLTYLGQVARKARVNGEDTLEKDKELPLWNQIKNVSSFWKGSLTVDLDLMFKLLDPYGEAVNAVISEDGQSVLGILLRNVVSATRETYNSRKVVTLDYLLQQLRNDCEALQSIINSAWANDDGINKCVATYVKDEFTSKLDNTQVGRKHKDTWLQQEDKEVLNEKCLEYITGPICLYERLAAGVKKGLNPFISKCIRRLGIFMVFKNGGPRVVIDLQDDTEKSCELAEELLRMLKDFVLYLPAGDNENWKDMVDQLVRKTFDRMDCIHIPTEDKLKAAAFIRSEISEQARKMQKTSTEENLEYKLYKHVELRMAYMMDEMQEKGDSIWTSLLDQGWSAIVRVVSSMYLESLFSMALAAACPCILGGLALAGLVIWDDRKAFQDGYHLFGVPVYAILASMVVDMGYHHAYGLHLRVPNQPVEGEYIGEMEMQHVILGRDLGPSWCQAIYRANRWLLWALHVVSVFAFFWLLLVIACWFCLGAIVGRAAMLPVIAAVACGIVLFGIFYWNIWKLSSNIRAVVRQRMSEISNIRQAKFLAKSHEFSEGGRLAVRQSAEAVDDPDNQQYIENIVIEKVLPVSFIFFMMLALMVFYASMMLFLFLGLKAFETAMPWTTALAAPISGLISLVNALQVVYGQIEETKEQIPDIVDQMSRSIGHSAAGVLGKSWDDEAMLSLKQFSQEVQQEAPSPNLHDGSSLELQVIKSTLENMRDEHLKNLTQMVSNPEQLQSIHTLVREVETVKVNTDLQLQIIQKLSGAHLGAASEKQLGNIMSNLQELLSKQQKLVVIMESKMDTTQTDIKLFAQQTEASVKELKVSLGQLRGTCEPSFGTSFASDLDRLLACSQAASECLRGLIPAHNSEGRDHPPTLDVLDSNAGAQGSPGEAARPNNPNDRGMGGGELIQGTPNAIQASSETDNSQDISSESNGSVDRAAGRTVTVGSVQLQDATMKLEELTSLLTSICPNIRKAVDPHDVESKTNKVQEAGAALVEGLWKLGGATGAAQAREGAVEQAGAALETSLDALETTVGVMHAEHASGADHSQTNWQDFQCKVKAVEEAVKFFTQTLDNTREELQNTHRDVGKVQYRPQVEFPKQQTNSQQHLLDELLEKMRAMEIRGTEAFNTEGKLKELKEMIGKLQAQNEVIKDEALKQSGAQIERLLNTNFEGLKKEIQGVTDVTSSQRDVQGCTHPSPPDETDTPSTPVENEGGTPASTTDAATPTPLESTVGATATLNAQNAPTLKLIHEESVKIFELITQGVQAQLQGLNASSSLEKKLDELVEKYQSAAAVNGATPEGPESREQLKQLIQQESSAQMPQGQPMSDELADSSIPENDAQSNSTADQTTPETTSEADRTSFQDVQAASTEHTSMEDFKNSFVAQLKDLKELLETRLPTTSAPEPSVSNYGMASNPSVGSETPTLGTTTEIGVQAGEGGKDESTGQPSIVKLKEAMKELLQEYLKSVQGTEDNKSGLNSDKSVGRDTATASQTDDLDGQARQGSNVTSSVPASVEQLKEIIQQLLSTQMAQIQLMDNKLPGGNIPDDDAERISKGDQAPDEGVSTKHTIVEELKSSLDVQLQELKGLKEMLETHIQTTSAPEPSISNDVPARDSRVGRETLGTTAEIGVQAAEVGKVDITPVDGKNHTAEELKIFVQAQLVSSTYSLKNYFEDTLKLELAKLLKNLKTGKSARDLKNEWDKPFPDFDDLARMKPPPTYSRPASATVNFRDLQEGSPRSRPLSAGASLRAYTDLQDASPRSRPTSPGGALRAKPDASPLGPAGIARLEAGTRAAKESQAMEQRQIRAGTRAQAGGEQSDPQTAPPSDSKVSTAQRAAQALNQYGGVGSTAGLLHFRTTGAATRPADELLESVDTIDGAGAEEELDVSPLPLEGINLGDLEGQLGGGQGGSGAA